MDIPLRLLDKFRKFLQDNHVKYKDEHEILGNLDCNETL